MKSHIALLVIVSCGQCYAGDKSTETALSLIKSQTHAVRIAEWRCDMSVFELQDPADANSIIRQRPNRIKCKVRVDPLGQRYSAEIDAVIPWVGGSRPVIGRTQGISYDGKTYRGWLRRSSDGTIPEKGVPTRGAISDRENDVASGSRFGTWTYSLDFGFFFPFIDTFENADARPATLYDFLFAKQKDGKLSFQINEDGIWQFATTLTKLRDCPFVIRYSPAKSAVVEAIWGVDDPSWQRWEATLEEYAPGVWAPKTATLTSTSRRRRVRFLFSDVKINPPAFDGQFRLRFPPGTRVKDHIRDMDFVVGAEDPEPGAERAR